MRFCGNHVLLAALMVAVSCSPVDSGPGDAVDAEARYGGTAVVGATADLQSLNALTSSDAISRMVQQYMLLMPLILFGDDLQPAPWLAERWDTVRVAPDTLELTFEIRRDIAWHDGTPTTAHDVLFTYQRAIDPATAFPNRASFELWSPRAEVTDSFTIRFRLRPHADFLSAWYELPIMPVHRLGDVAPAELANHPFGTAAPVGNGPFRFVRRLPNQEWVFEANPEFPEALGGRPYLDRVVYRIIPEQTTLLTELLTGRIHAYPTPNPNQTDQLQGARGVRLLSSPYRSYTYIGWNTKHPLFQDARVRRALSLAIDRQAILDALLFGHGEMGVSTSTPAHWAFDDEYRRLTPPHDRDLARGLLAEAGWRPGDDGILRNERGTPFRFTLVTNHGSDLRRDIGEIVQAQLRPIGIQVQPRAVEWNTLITMLDGHLDETGERVRDFEAVISGWVNAFRKDDSAVLHSRNLNSPYQETSFANPRVDQLIDTLNLMIDRAQARPLWQEYHEILLRESPYTVLHYPNRLLAHREQLRGVELGPQGEFVSVRRWWLAR